VINGLTDTNVTALAISDSNIFVGTDGSGIFLSSNDGQLWDSVNTGLPANTIVLSFAISGNNIFAGTNNNGVFLSTNNGSSWTAVNGGLLDNTGIGALAIKGSNIFAGVYNWQTGNWGVYLSSNNGVSWNSISYGLINSNILVLATNDSNIFVGTYFGLWKLPLSEMGIKELNNNTSNIAVYPNPATNNIIIETLQKSTIEILNIQGQTVIQQQIQQGKTDIDISGLAKGVYILRLCSNDKTEVARIVKE
jgi:hypothetical protein